MSSSLESLVAGVFLGDIPLAIFIYATYWSFAIRRAQVVRSYRNHALFLGLMCAIIAYSLSPLTYLLPDFPNPFILISVGLFAFVDSTIPVARRSDPLMRPFLNWARTRKALWILNSVLVAGWFVFDNGGFPFWAVIVVTLPIGIGVPALITGSRRSGDILFRQSLRWVGIAVLFFGAGVLSFFLLSSFLPSPYDFSQSYAAIPTGVFLAFAAYSFYRSARSLAPINKLEDFETERVPTTVISMQPDSGK